MINTVALKTKVLALAFRGELSEQTDENAKVLLKRVFEEKDLLIKEKKVKKNKTKPITNDEILFTIPSNWLWVRLGEVINLQSGQDLTTSDYNDKELGVPYITGASNFRTDESLIINRWTVNPKAIAVEDDILLSVKGTVGKLAFLHEEKVHIARQIMGIRPIGLNRKYVKYFVQEQVEELKAISKGLIPGIERDNVLNMLMPMPPLGEQEQIVEKIEEAFAWLDTIDLLQHQYSSDLEILKSKIIDAGMQGKLTEQLPEDGTAEELLEQIKDEKKALEDAGVYKNKKKIVIKNSISDEDVYDIPKTWKWVRLGQLADVYGRIGFRGYTKADLVEQGQGAISMSPSNITFSGDVVFENNTYISWEKYDESPEIKVRKGDVLIVKTGSSYGKTGIIEEMPEKCTINPQLAILKNILGDRHYLNFYMKSSHAWSQYKSFVVGAATPTFSQEKLANMLIPLPPLREQKRIVDKIDEMLSIVQR